MDEPGKGKLGRGDLVKGWCAALAAIGAGAVLYWDLGGLVAEEDNAWLNAHHDELGLAFGVVGILFALAISLHGSELGFRVQSLLLAGIGGAVCALFAWKGLDEGWGVGSGALTFVFGVFALVKLKHVLLGRGAAEE